MKQPLQYFFTKSGYMYLWKFLELLTIIIAARFLTIIEFSESFFAIVLAYFLMSFFYVSMNETDTIKIKNFLNTLSLVSSLYGIFVGVILFVISMIYPLTIPLRFATIIALFLGFRISAEIFYKSRNREEKVYFLKLISQVVASIVLFVLIYFNFKEISVLISYVVYNILTTIMLWTIFPFKIKSRFDKESYLTIISSVKSNLKINLTKNISLYAPLIIVGFYNRIYFSYIYLAFVIGYFLYKNLTIFITDLFKEKFLKMSYDMFKYNLVKLTEYLSFIIFPISLINLVLVPQISSIVVNWEGFSEILLMILFAGLIKSISEISRLIFIVEPKETVAVRLSVVELIFLFLFMLILGDLFGSYGIAMAIVLSVIISSIINLLVAQRLIKLDLITVSKNFFFIVLSALISTLSVGLLKEWFNVKSMFSLAFVYFIGVVIYIGLTFLINKEFYKQFVRFIFEVFEE